jgi:hypothetical protein
MQDCARRLDRRQAAAFLTERGWKTAPSTLAKLACIGGGPPFRSYGKRPLHKGADLLAWAEARTTGPRRSTTDPGSRPAPDTIRKADLDPEPPIGADPATLGEWAGTLAVAQVEAKYGRKTIGGGALP